MSGAIKIIACVTTSIVVTGLLLDQMQRGTFGETLNNFSKRIANGYGDFDNNNGV